MEDAVKYFVTLLNQVKLFHWTTTSYAMHKALDGLHDSLSPLVDQFIESYIGHFKQQPVKVFKVKIELTSNAANARKFLETQRDTLTNMVKDYKTSPGLENILAEMVALFDNTIYLSNLH